jgi:hypothetical protein
VATLHGDDRAFGVDVLNASNVHSYRGGRYCPYRLQRSQTLPELAQPVKDIVIGTTAGSFF